MRWLVLVTLVFAGCTTTPTETVDPTHPDVPDWVIGESWSFQGQEDGIHQIWTVMETKVKDGVPMLRLQLEWYFANGTYWNTAQLIDDMRTLDAIEMQNGGFHDLFACDDSGLFPLESKDYTCDINRNGESHVLFFERTIGPVENVTTPLGTFSATKIVNFNPELNEGEGRISTINWYSEEVGQIVQFWEQGDLFILQDWNRPA